MSDSQIDFNLPTGMSALSIVETDMMIGKWMRIGRTPRCGIRIEILHLDRNAFMLDWGRFIQKQASIMMR